MSSQNKENKGQGKKEIPVPTFSFKRVNNSEDRGRKNVPPIRSNK